MILLLDEHLVCLSVFLLNSYETFSIDSIFFFFFIMTPFYVQSQGPRGAPGEIGPPGSPVNTLTTSLPITVKFVEKKKFHKAEDTASNLTTIIIKERFFLVLLIEQKGEGLKI